jgi:hypothetical protein
MRKKSTLSSHLAALTVALAGNPHGSGIVVCAPADVAIELRAAFHDELPEVTILTETDADVTARPLPWDTGIRAVISIDETPYPAALEEWMCSPRTVVQVESRDVV